MLQVGVHRDDDVGIGIVQSRRKRGLMAEVSRQDDVADSIVIVSELLDDLHRCVVTPVINDH
jgi:hypothetical protein